MIREIQSLGYRVDISGIVEIRITDAALIPIVTTSDIVVELCTLADTLEVILVNRTNQKRYKKANFPRLPHMWSAIRKWLDWNLSEHATKYPFEGAAQ